ncbi:MAG: SDR family oxidoreductase [Candidatus Binatia bacterium]|nr:SDR family oxidoreductase [Candidatus Binatia bacterium]
MNLVTGGAGFIGSHIAAQLLANGEKVRILDDFSTGKQSNLAAFKDDVEVIEGDLRDPDALERAVQGCQYVYQQAALRSVPRSIDDPRANNDVNVTGILNLLIASKKAGVQRVVYASSSSVYGADPTLPKVETQTPQPISPYAASKIMGEYYCRIYSNLYDLETVSMRYFNVFGPRQDPESKYAAVIPRFICAALADEAAEVHGDGEQSRDFTFIDNVVSANLLAAKAPGVAGEPFNIACNERYSLLDVLTQVEKGLGKPVKRNHEPDRAGDVKHTLADISKARELLKYEPLVNFEDGMKLTVDWFAANA